MMDTNELIGLTASFLAALAFGTYGVPMKGEAGESSFSIYTVLQSFAIITTIYLYLQYFITPSSHILQKATRVDVDPLVFQTYKAFTVFVSYILYVDIYLQYDY